MQMMTITVRLISTVAMALAIVLILALAFAIGLFLPGRARAQDPQTGQKPVPITRQEMKEALEALKKSKPRLPLPALTDAEKAKFGAKMVNNGRMRLLYLPEELRGGGAGFGKEADSGMTLSSDFKTMLFWIVARTTNCHY